MFDLINSNAIARVLVLALVFMVVVGLSAVAMTFVSRRMAVRGELRSIARYTAGGTPIDHLATRRDDRWTRMADRIEKAGLNLSDTKPDVLRDKLRSAGFDAPSAPRLYTLIRLALVILLPALVVVAMAGSGKNVTYFKLYIFGSVAALFGLYAPALFIQARADRRRDAIVRGFPDALDLMLVCVEAGLGLEAAMDRVGREMTVSSPSVAKLLTIVNLRIRAGATREDALRHMSDEARVDEIKSFATLLIQSDKLGTSIATTLRIYAAEMRERRRLRAEEKAHRIPVLISIPLVACMLPVIIGVLMLPAAIMVVRELVPAMTGG